MTEKAQKRLLIDLAKCDQCSQPADGCEVLALREKATFALICRRCEHASCIIACPFDALERSEDGGVIRRHNLRCVSCKSCALACPFGTIYDELLPFYNASCEATLEAAVGAASAAIDRGENQESRLKPLLQCLNGALEYREVDPAEPGVHIVDEQLAARTQAWAKLETGEEAGA
jgi:Fe-S-cluster-containing hydrogenase component 2